MGNDKRLAHTLRQVINEALRLFSPAGGNQQRVVPPGGATMIVIRSAGITVAGSPWAAGHSAPQLL